MTEFIIDWPDDPAALNPNLYHLACGKTVCAVEQDDTLSALNLMAQEHVCEEKQA